MPHTYNWTSVYQDYFRQDALQLLAWGHQDICSQRLDDLEETDITGFISEAIDKRLQSLSIPDRFDRYAIKEDNPSTGENRTGKRRRRLDLVIERVQSGPRPRYTFEAK